MENTKLDSEQNIHIKISQSIIANQIAMNFNQEIKHTGYFKKNLKAKLLPVQLELIKAEREEFEKFFDKVEKASVDVYAAMSEMITEFSKVGIMHTGAITEIIKAYQKDPKSIQGIVNKINR